MINIDELFDGVETNIFYMSNGYPKTIQKVIIHLGTIKYKSYQGNSKQYLSFKGKVIFFCGSDGKFQDIDGVIEFNRITFLKMLMQNINKKDLQEYIDNDYSLDLEFKLINHKNYQLINLEVIENEY